MRGRNSNTMIRGWLMRIALFRDLEEEAVAWVMPSERGGKHAVRKHLECKYVRASGRSGRWSGSRAACGRSSRVAARARPEQSILVLRHETRNFEEEPSARFPRVVIWGISEPPNAEREGVLVCNKLLNDPANISHRVHERRRTITAVTTASWRRSGCRLIGQSCGRKRLWRQRRSMIGRTTCLVVTWRALSRRSKSPRAPSAARGRPVRRGAVRDPAGTSCGTSCSTALEAVALRAGSLAGSVSLSWISAAQYGFRRPT